MRDELEDAQGWFRKAESDLSNARRTTASEGPYDTACFHAQQAAEKYLKGFLTAHGYDEPPRTHNLVELARLADHVASPLGIGLGELAELSYYAVEVRYDLDMWPDREREIETAERVKAALLEHIPEEAHP